MLTTLKSTILLTMVINCYADIVRSTTICSLDFGRKILEKAEMVPAKLSNGKSCGEIMIKEGQVNTEYHCLEACFMIQDCHAIFYDPVLRWCNSYRESANLQSCFTDVSRSSSNPSYYVIFPRQEFRNKLLGRTCQRH
eukprot:Seg97.11 transcript_id=Seg97.11/GoldUCD/mRNA.D3Y31 product="hypothetical protein" protein_id=Seg97.11/GoldUCD/D3Y31